MNKRKVAVDVCIPRPLVKVLETVYWNYGYSFTHVLDLGGGPDEDWARKFHEQGGDVVLSGDMGIGRRPHQQAAFIDSGLICYFPKHPFQELGKFKKSAYLIHNWELIHHHLLEVKGPSCWAMPTKHRNDVLSLSKIEFKKMNIPESVLSDLRQVTDDKF